MLLRCCPCIDQLPVSHCANFVFRSIWKNPNWPSGFALEWIYFNGRLKGKLEIIKYKFNRGLFLLVFSCLKLKWFEVGKILDWGSLGAWGFIAYAQKYITNGQIRTDGARNLIEYCWTKLMSFLFGVLTFVKILIKQIKKMEYEETKENNNS